MKNRQRPIPLAFVLLRLEYVCLLLFGSCLLLVTGCTDQVLARETNGNSHRVFMPLVLYGYEVGLPIATTTATATETADATATATPTSTATATPTPTGTATVTATATPDGGEPGFTDCVSHTGSNAIVAVPKEINIIGSYEPAFGDQVAIFTPDGSICAGVATWTKPNIAVTAWGDNTLTEEIDGLRGGETMRFRIWDLSADQAREVTAVTYSMGNGLYSAGSIHIVSSFTVAPP